MPWGKIDDRLHGHPKATAAGLDGMGLWVLALSWSSAYGTDGFVPEAKVSGLGGNAELAQRLVNAGLWDRVPGGYQIHDYLDYNPSAEQVEAQRQANAERQARWRREQEEREQAEAPNDYENNGVSDGVSNGSRNGVTNGVTNSAPVPVPSPVPSPEPEKDGATAPARSPPKLQKREKPPPAPEAVKVFRSNAHRYPAKSWYDDIAEMVGDKQADLDFWGQVVKAYVGLGWNPTNVKGMLDFYERREVPGNDKNTPPPHPSRQQYAEYAAPERSPPSELDQAWSLACAHLKGTMDGGTFEAHFARARPVSLEGRVLVVALPSDAALKAAERLRAGAQVARGVAGVGEVEFVVEEG
jgi:hypothetical protein